MVSKVNLHLFLSEVLRESRLFKEVKFTISNRIFDRVVVLGLWSADLPARETLDCGLEVIRARTLVRRYKRFLASGYLVLVARKLLAAFGIVEYAYASIVLSLNVRPSHISCHNVYLLPIGWLCAKLSNAELVYVPHELESERTGLHAAGKRIAKSIELLFLESCKAVVVVCEPIARWYSKNIGVDHLYVVRNTPSAADIPEIKVRGNLLRSEFQIPEAEPIYIYQGVLGKERGIPKLIERFSQTSAKHLVLMGYGDMVAEIIRVSRERNNIHYKDAVPMRDIVSYTAGADFGVFVVEGELSLSYSYSLPNKFFEYLHAGIPVIVSENLTYLTSIVRSCGLGLALGASGESSTFEWSDQLDRDQVIKNIVEYRKNCVWEFDAVNYFKIYS
jgi:glycosyltransferase involved in cell wall biosynthesis